MTGTCDHCGREYYNASGCECILVGAAPLNTTATEVNAMKATLNDPGPRPNDPSPPPNCDNCGAHMPPGAHEDPASGILLCPGGCAPTGDVPADLPHTTDLATRAAAVLGDAGDGSPMGDLAAALDAVESLRAELRELRLDVDRCAADENASTREAAALRQTIRDLATALLMDPGASPADVLRKTRLVMAERMEMQAADLRRG